MTVSQVVANRLRGRCSPGVVAQEAAHDALVASIVAAREAYTLYYEALDSNAPDVEALWATCLRADAHRFAAEARIATGVRVGWPEVALRDAEARLIEVVPAALERGGIDGLDVVEARAAWFAAVRATVDIAASAARVVAGLESHGVEAILAADVVTSHG